MNHSLLQLKPLKAPLPRAHTTRVVLLAGALAGSLTSPAFCQSQVKPTQAGAPLRLGVVDEARLSQARSDFPMLAARVLPQVAAKRQLSLVVSKQGMRWNSTRFAASDVTNDVLALLKNWPLTAGALTGEQRMAAQKALASLNALGVVLRVGNPSYTSYNERFVDTSIVFEANVKGVPEGALKTKLTQAIRSFLDLRNAWDKSLEDIKRGHQSIQIRYDTLRSIMGRHTPEDQLTQWTRDEAEEREKVQREALKPLAAAQEKPLQEIVAAEKLLPPL